MTKHLSEIAKNILPGENIDSIAYGCTSGTVAIGDKKIMEEIHKSKKNSHVTTPVTAALKAFSKLNIKKVSILTPYPKHVNETIFNYFLNKNIEIVSFNSFNLEYDSEIANVDPKCLIETINKIDHKEADAVFISCTALRVVEVLQEIEARISKNVISSNQAIIWDSLRSINVKKNINGYGELFNN